MGICSRGKSGDSKTDYGNQPLHQNAGDRQPCHCGLRQTGFAGRKRQRIFPQDCGAAIENLLLQATDLGYGTCWCGFYPVMERVEKLRDLLKVSSVPLAVIAVGEADEEPKTRGFFDKERVTYIE